MLEDAEQQPKEGRPGASKSKGKQPAQAAEGAEAPPEETPPDPIPTKPHTDPAPVEPQPGTSKAPTGDPTQTTTDDPTQPTTKNPDEDKPPALTKYAMVYKAAGKAWLDSVVKDGKEAYIRLFNKLLELGGPYIDNFDQADREQVFKCIRDKTGRFLDDDDFVTYVETEEEKKKPRYILTGDAKVALTDYYDAVHTLCEAQQNFAKSTQVLENLQGVDVDVPPTKLQKDQPQRQRPNQNDGRIHLLRPVQTDHPHKGITDRLRHWFQMSNNAIQETDNREETAWRTRQVERGERRIQQKPRSRRQTGRSHTRQKNKKNNQISNTSKSKSNTQR